jgi:hypothetical protein
MGCGLLGFSLVGMHSAVADESPGASQEVLIADAAASKLPRLEEVTVYAPNGPGLSLGGATITRTDMHLLPSCLRRGPP